MIWILILKLEIEVVLCVVVADILDHLTDEIKLAGGQQTLLNILTDKITQRTAEILVTRIAQEAA
jgi:hypothetical protein